jgi:hypothetical protein
MASVNGISDMAVGFNANPTSERFFLEPFQGKFELSGPVNLEGGR